jgi:hypothetical protein
MIYRAILIVTMAIATLFCCSAPASETRSASLDDVMDVTTGVERDYEAPEPGVVTLPNEFDAPKEIWLEGIVTCPAGRPVFDATIHFKSGPVDQNGIFIGLEVHTVQTHGNGSYRFRAEHDMYNITVLHKPKGVAVKLNVSPSEFDGKPLNFELAPVLPPLPHSVNGVTRTT